MSQQHGGSSRRISSDDIAKKMGVSLNTVYVYRSNDRSKLPGPARFPDPVGYDGRTVLFDEAEIDAYIEARSQRRGAAGRPPRTAQPDDSGDAPFATRLRRAVASGAGEPDVSTLRQLAGRLSLNTVTLGERLRGRTAWKPEELTTLEQLLSIATSDANDHVQLMRAQRRAARRSKA